MATEDNIIKMPHLIICEGIDDKNYLIYFLQSISANDKRFESFQVIEAGGKDNLPIFIKTLPRLPNFANVKSITVARDSDNNPQGASDSVRTLFRNSGFSVPASPGKAIFPDETSIYDIKVGYVLFPKINSEDTPGTLELLCLNTIANPNKDKVLEIADSAIESVKKITGGLEPSYKNRLHTYLSLTDNFVGKKIGEAAKANAFDFYAGENQKLKSFLADMLQT